MENDLSASNLERLARLNVLVEHAQLRRHVSRDTPDDLDLENAAQRALARTLQYATDCIADEVHKAEDGWKFLSAPVDVSFSRISDVLDPKYIKPGPEGREVRRAALKKAEGFASIFSPDGEMPAGQQVAVEAAEALNGVQGLQTEFKADEALELAWRLGGAQHEISDEIDRFDTQVVVGSRTLDEVGDRIAELDRKIADWHDPTLDSFVEVRGTPEGASFSRSMPSFGSSVVPDTQLDPSGSQELLSQLTASSKTLSAGSQASQGSTSRSQTIAGSTALDNEESRPRYDLRNPQRVGAGIAATLSRTAPVAAKRQREEREAGRNAEDPRASKIQRRPERDRTSGRPRTQRDGHAL